VDLTASLDTVVGGFPAPVRNSTLVIQPVAVTVLIALTCLPHSYM